MPHSSNATLRAQLLQTGSRIGLYRIISLLTRHRLRVLTYHSVVDVGSHVRQSYPFVYRNAVSAAQFDQQMRYVARHHRVISPLEFYEFLQGGELPSRAVLLTFDDGLINNTTVAEPILEKYDLPAVFFLPTAFVDAASTGRQRHHWSEEIAALIESHPAARKHRWRLIQEALPETWPHPSGSAQSYLSELLGHLKQKPAHDRAIEIQTFRDALHHSLSPELFPADPDGNSILHTMTWSDAQKLAAKGHTIGSHTVNHAILSRVDDQQARREIAKSKEIIERKVNASCRLFSYPNGSAEDFTDTHISELKRARYAAAFTQVRSFAAPKAAPMQTNRIDVSGDYQPASFEYLISGAKHLLVDPILRHFR